MGLIKEFREFLDEYKVIALAVAFIMGGAINALVQSLVDDLIMPVITFFIPGGAWQEATLTIGSIVFNWGSFLSAAINFTIIAFVVFLLVKLVAKDDKKK
jgi:large conductance mechanosensitive channel